MTVKNKLFNITNAKLLLETCEEGSKVRLRTLCGPSHKVQKNRKVVSFRRNVVTLKAEKSLESIVQDGVRTDDVLVDILEKNLTCQKKECSEWAALSCYSCALDKRLKILCEACKEPFHNLQIESSKIDFSLIVKKNGAKGKGTVEPEDRVILSSSTSSALVSPQSISFALVSPPSTSPALISPPEIAIEPEPDMFNRTPQQLKPRKRGTTGSVDQEGVEKNLSGTRKRSEITSRIVSSKRIRSNNHVQPGSSSSIQIENLNEVFDGGDEDNDEVGNERTVAGSFSMAADDLTTSCLSMGQRTPTSENPTILENQLETRSSNGKQKRKKLTLKGLSADLDALTGKVDVLAGKVDALAGKVDVLADLNLDVKLLTENVDTILKALKLGKFKGGQNRIGKGGRGKCKRKRAVKGTQ